MAEMAYLPKDIWTEIASLLDEESLFRFGRVCKSMQLLVSSLVILKPLYNRLCALDQTLSADLPEKDSFDACKKAFLKIEARQKEEIIYLQKHHPKLTSEYDEVWKDNTSATLASLEAKNAALDEINSKIITKKIDVNGTSLFLSGARITRFPTSLFQVEKFMNFWKNLRVLDLTGNQLTALSLRGLEALETLYCYNNQLTALHLQDLMALKELNCSNNHLTVLNLQGLLALNTLDCYNNKLTVLDVQGLLTLKSLYCSNNQLRNLNLEGLVALEVLNCDNNQLTTLNLQSLQALMAAYFNNPLIDLNLTGVPKEIKDKYAGLEKSLLWKQLDAAVSVEEQQRIIARLGKDYTDENCLYCAPIYAAMTLSPNIISQAASYIPSYSSAVEKMEVEEEVEVEMDEEHENKKRKRPEEDDKKLDDSKRMKKG